jgi:hypothetical protein
MNNRRLFSFVLFGVVVFLVLWLIGSQFSREKPAVFAGGGNTGRNTAASSQSVLPWDYKVVEATVGDLINGDMVLLPDNLLLPNDRNYATGDKVWVLQYMSASMSTGADNKSSISLSSWQPIKSYESRDQADEALKSLKEQISTEVDLVGVYKTEYNGQFREFAVLTLPTGNQIKQPISEERYHKMKNEKKAKVVLEEVHNYENYDSAMAKFRGWAD